MFSKKIKVNEKFSMNKEVNSKLTLDFRCMVYQFIHPIVHSDII